MTLQYREVTGFFTARIPDSGDADLNPDTIPLTGNVTFHPEYRKPLVFPGEHIVLEPINAIIIDGQLMVEVIQGEDVVLQALHLPVTMDERANQTWSWTMRFHGMTLGQYGEEVSLPDRRFPIEEGSGPLDLSEVAGQWSGGGLITRGPRGYGVTSISADDGVVTVEWEGGSGVEIPIPTAALATPTTDGLMAASDKTKLNTLQVPYKSGLRNISGRFSTLTGGDAFISRSGDTVTFSLDDVQFSSRDTFTVTAAVPSGFRPDRRILNGLAVMYRGDDSLRISVSSSGNLALYFYGGGHVRWFATYLTADAPPSSPPGVPG